MARRRSTGHRRLLLILYSSLLALLGAATTSGKASSLSIPRRRPLPAVFAFGDSIVDTGNNDAILTLTKANFPPYGKDLDDLPPTGRFSNGRIPPDLVASRVCLKELLPAYLGSDLSPDDFATGVSFGSAGTGYDPLTSTLVAVIPISEQLELFAEYKERLRGIVGDDKAAFIVSESLYIVCAGTDDIANNYFSALVRQLQYDLPSYVDFLIDKASDFIKQLYEGGARKIAVLGLPPVGCIPQQRTVAGGLERRCSQVRNEAALLFNAKLKEAISRLQGELQRQRIGYVEIYDILLDMILHPRQYGFVESSKGCCGSGKVEVALLCNSLTATTCSNDTEYVFWDAFHPTQRAYEIMVDYLFPRYVEKLLL